jgi:hypothetical protein
MSAHKTVRSLILAIAVATTFGISSAAHAALAKSSGGSGYSGTLSKNKSIRQQQVIADPAASGAPTDGSTSITYDPSIVSLVDAIAGPSYFISGVVGVNGEGGPFLQDLFSFLEEPDGNETGYVQVSYTQTPVASFAKKALAAASAGQLTPPSGYTITDNNGVAGFDTHALFFKYNEEVPDSTVATYNIFAATAGQFDDNDQDFLRPPDGGPDLGPADLASATVKGSLDSPAAAPLPPASLAGGLLMAMLLGAKLFARRRAF